jgi:hypothetical protein
MLAAPLLVVTLALPASGQASHLDVSASGDVEYRAYGFADRLRPGPVDAHTVEGGAGIAADLYFDPIVDDDAAPSLQPFLQRAAYFHLAGGGSGFTTDSEFLGGGRGRRTGSSGHGTVGLAGYFGPSKSVYGSVYFTARGDSFTDNGGPSHGDLELSPRISVGVRWRDLRVRVAWGLAARRIDDQEFKVPFWGNASLHIYGVVRRRLELTAETYVLEGGASAFGDATLWLARRFGLDVAVGGGRYTPEGSTTDFVRASAGLTVWLTPRFALDATYFSEYARYIDARYDSMEHRAIVGVIFRPL